jgi:2-phospho-L-lactate guanylyltransferase
MKVSALIPAKGFANAKQRLSPLLGKAEREQLAEAMLRDVLRETKSARGLESIHVVTGDARVREIALSLGVEVILEPEEKGETGAVTFALGELKQRGIHAALVLPADLPLLRSGDIETLLGQAAAHDDSSPFALLVPSHDRMGTNALLLSPPDVIELRFGYDSFSYHLSQVAAQGLPPRVVENTRIALDIDEPPDLERFFAVGNETGESYARLVEMEWAAASSERRRSGSL